MTIDDTDVSSYGGEPVMLYDFYRKSTPTTTGVLVETHWRYTSADRDLTIGGNLYTAIPISNDAVKQSGDTSADQLTISMPYNETIPSFFVGSPPSDPIYCGILHADYNDADDAFLVWVGIVGMVSRSSDGDGGDDAGNITASISCNTVGATMDRAGLRLAWSRLCPHDLYGFGCKALPMSHVFTGLVTALTGTTLTVAAFGTSIHTFVGGFVEWLDDYGHAERLGIIGHSGATITVLGITDRITVGTEMNGFIGCDHSRTTCHDTFNNLPNHGGHAYMPDQNPFNGDSVF